MKTAVKLLLTCLCFLALDKAIRTQTNGFRLQKTYQDLPASDRWEVTNAPLPEGTLNQAFYFLGSGVQFYAFLGEDKKTVLKLFKHYHFGPSTTFLKRLPGCNAIVAKRTGRIERIFESVKLALDPLSETTGVVHVSLNPKPNNPTITLYDKIGIRYALDLSRAPFVLQRYAKPLKKEDTNLPSLPKHIICTDVAERNIGKIDHNLVYVDIGSFEEVP